MIRRLKKVTSQAELQQLIEAGIIVSPYIAFDSSSNVTNMVLPAEREISEIEYEQESNIPIRLVSPIEPDYYVQEGFTACRLSFTVHPEHIDGHDMLFLLMCQKAWFDEAYVESGESTRESFISILLSNAYNGTDNILNFSYAYAVNINSRSAFPFDTDVPYVVSAENMAGDDLMWVPYDNSYPNDNTYYLFYGYSTTGEPGSFDIVGEVAQYRVMPYLSNNAEFVQLGMNVAGTQRGNCVDIDIRVPGNTLYDRVKYGWYLGGYSSEDAIAADRIAVCDATTIFSASDHNAPEYVNNTDQPLTGYVSVQLFNSVTGVTGAPTAFAMMTVQPSESGGDDSSIRLLGSINREWAHNDAANVVYSKLSFTAEIEHYEDETDFDAVYPVFYFINKNDFNGLEESYSDTPRNELLWKYIDDTGGFEASPDVNPSQWDSSVYFELDAPDDILGPETPQYLEDDPDVYTWILVGIYSDDGDITWGGQGYPGDDKVFELGQIQIPLYSPVTLDSSILYEIGHAPYDEYPDFEAKLKIGSYTDNFSEEGYSDLKMMFVSKNGFMNIMNDGNSVQDTIAFFLNDNASDATWALDLDSSTQGYYVTSWYNDVTTGSDDYDCMYMPNASQQAYEDDIDSYIYYLIAGHYVSDDEEYSNYALSCGIVGSVTLPYYLENTPANIWKYGHFFKNDNDGTIEYYFDAAVTPNSCYPKFAIGLYSQEAFETAYSESGTSDSSTEYLNTFQDDGQMFEYYSVDYDENSPFSFGDQFDPEDIPGYTEGDTICMALWFLDENDDIGGNVTYVATFEDEDEGGDSSTDVSLGYKFSVGANNGGYFNTGYVPGADTVVQLKGKIINDGASAHGIKGDYNDWMYRIFGNEGDVYFDRMDDQVRITAAVNDIENTSHEYEFGNYYIKVDGVTEATDSESDLSNFYTEISLLVFATSQIGAMGETILDTLAAPGTEVEYFKILEPDGNGGLNLEKDLRPALDASGNVCMYDQVAGDIIYPEGSSVNIIATAIGPEVLCTNYSDDGEGNIEFDAWLNEIALDASMYYRIAVTSTGDWNAYQFDLEEQGETPDENDYILQCAEEQSTGIIHRVGTENNPDSINVTYIYDANILDNGAVIGILFDSNDNMVDLFTLGYWNVDTSWQYTCPNCGEPMEFEEGPCDACGWPNTESEEEPEEEPEE